jgi:hypothetical protein
MSGFGKTGNHLIENNRIHNNSFGIFFESTWDLGSVIRYNLIYENHHQTTAFASQVKNLTDEGSNQPGGAIAFKDHSLSPVAIYNNTFYKNYLIFVGHWRPALQCLVFNNIYSKPFSYWSSKRAGLIPGLNLVLNLRTECITVYMQHRKKNRNSTVCN